MLNLLRQGYTDGVDVHVADARIQAVIDAVAQASLRIARLMVQQTIQGTSA